MMRQLTIASAFCTCFLLSKSPALAAPSDGASEKVFLGYVAGMPSDINYNMYTHLCHAFVVAEKDGTLLPRENVPNHELTSEAHKAGVKVLISLGGWGWDDNFGDMSLDPPAEDRYVNAVMALVDEYDYDGIDLDWEYPDTNIEIVGFERLSRRFRKRLDELGEKKNRSMLLTMAAAAHPQTLEWLSNEFLLETMDWVNIMTYDYVGSWADFAGHHSPLFASGMLPKDNVLSTELTIKYLLEERKFPANRLALGIPLYGRVFAVGKPYASTVDAPKPDKESANYKEIYQLQEQQNWTRWWDDETKNPWLIAPDKSEIICYDDSESIEIKTEWAKKQGLRGIFFWQIDADRMPDGSNPLQETAHEKLNQIASPE
jgi:chitinase